jgi:hypothetical protein
MAGVGGIIQGLSTAGFGIMQASEDAQTAYEQWSANDRTLAYNAHLAALRGAREAGRLRMLGAYANETQKVGYAASNVDPTSGTAAAVQADSAALTELDAQTVKNNAARDAWGFKLQRAQGIKNLQRGIQTVDRQGAGSIVTGFGQALGGAAGI